MLRLIINFLKGLFDSKGNVSSKRVIAILCMLLIIEMVQATVWWSKDTPSELLYTITVVMLACLGLNTVITTKSIEKKTDIASDIIKEEPTQESADNAKDVLNSDKPQ